MSERVHEDVWAVCTHEEGTVSLRGVDYYRAGLHAQDLIRRGFRQVCVYPEDEARAIYACTQVEADAETFPFASPHHR